MLCLKTVAFLLMALPSLSLSDNSSDVNWIEECRKQASNPWEPGNNGHGILFNKIYPEQAKIACSKAYTQASNEAANNKMSLRTDIYFYRLGRILHKEQDYKDAFGFFQEAAIMEYAPAQNGLGLMFLNGEGITKNKDEALKWFSKAASQNYAPAQVNLGLILSSDNGKDQNQTKAFSLFFKAAEQGHPDGQYMVGLRFHQGIGTAQDFCKARYWYREAMEHGSLGGQTGLGLLYYNGECVQKDQAKGRKLVVQAAEKGDEYAKGMLKQMVPKCGQEFNIAPSKKPCGKEWRAQGEWKSKYWCYTDYNFRVGSQEGATFCTNGFGTWDRNGILDPCKGKEGWCSGTWKR